MGSWAFENLTVIASLLAQQAAQPATTASTSSSGLVIFCQWPLFAGVIAGIIALCKLAHTVFKNEHNDVDRARLSLEQVTSSYFVEIVIQESRRVFLIIDDHLPDALTKPSSVGGAPLTRFTHFCQSLRKLSSEELVDEKSKYRNIIQESFAGIVSECASRLFEAMTRAGESADGPLNPTGARYSLEGDGFLSFAHVAEFDYQNRRLVTRFRRIWTSVGVLSVLAIICGFGVLVGIILDSNWAEKCARLCLVPGIVCVILALLASGVSYLVKRSLINRSEKYGDQAAVREYVKQLKEANGGTD